MGSQVQQDGFLDIVAFVMLSWENADRVSVVTYGEYLKFV